MSGNTLATIKRIEVFISGIGILRDYYLWLFRSLHVKMLQPEHFVVDSFTSFILLIIRYIPQTIDFVCTVRKLA